MNFQQQFIVDDIISFSREDRYQDLTIICQNGTFQSNSLVLAAMFPVMKSLLSSGHQEDEHLIISIPDMEILELETLFHGLYHQTAIIKVGTVLKELLDPSINSGAFYGSEDDEDDSILIKQYDNILDTKQVDVNDYARNTKIIDHTYNSKELISNAAENFGNVKDEDIDMLDVSQYSNNDDSDKQVDVRNGIKIETIEKHAKESQAFEEVKKEVSTVCLYCGKNYTSHRKLREHIRRYHDEDILQCEICSKQIKGKKNLSNHMMIHNPKVKCSGCNKFFKETTIRRHKLQCVNLSHFEVNQSKACNVCDFLAQTPIDLKKHMEQHKRKQNDHMCLFCDMRFITRERLRAHMKKHPKLECPDCDKSFSKQETLEKHRVKMHATVSVSNSGPFSDNEEHEDDSIEQYDNILDTKQNIEIIDHTYNSNIVESYGDVKNKDMLDDVSQYSNNIDSVKAANVVTVKIARKTDIDDYEILRKCVGNEYVYQCKFCDYTAKKRSNLKRHMRSNICDPNREKRSMMRRVCVECGFSTKDTNSYISHLMSAHGVLAEIVSGENDLHSRKNPNSKRKNGLVYHCIKCDFHTSKTTHWKEHRERAHDIGVPVTCEICGKLCKGKFSLAAHKVIHEGEERKKCSKCGSLYHIKNFESHNCLPNKCDICGKICTTGKNLLGHKKRIHELPVSTHFCNICGKGLSSSSALTGHMKRHIEEKFPCQECGKLIKPGQINAHNRFHHAPKNFKCEVCSKCFPDPGSLEKHTMSVHLKLRPYKCRYGLGCEFAYNDVSNRDAHERKKHGKIFTTFKEEKIKAILALKDV